MFALVSSSSGGTDGPRLKSPLRSAVLYSTNYRGKTRAAIPNLNSPHFDSTTSPLLTSPETVKGVDEGTRGLRAHQRPRSGRSSAARRKTMSEIGYTFPHGCRITHGQGANVKKPFKDIDLTMYELSPSNEKGFKGQFGFIKFNTEYRLPRHIHMTIDREGLIDERIMILHGVALVEIAGEYLAVAPGSLVYTRGGVPHTFTACPAGVKLPDGSTSSGTFTMVYEYEEPTTFFPTESMEVVDDPTNFKPWEGDLESIRFPIMSAQDVVEKGRVIFDRQKWKLSLA
ncbi:hypothetical protein AC579_7873 [Pseudocercospora musae]|uniref:Uncharacterized protein n=1 Tax=Pseudocercospora musae TaxID=113226 RepID=A0A139I2U2_9PEZI|nr:hypothetical protein AC579_7873 [Pseudocercospora musae]